MFQFCRSALQEILVHVLKHADHYEALNVLYTLAFKHSPSQNFSKIGCSANTSTDDGEQTGNVCINLMSNNFVFAYGDDGGVVIKVQNDDIAEGDADDGILSNLRRDGLSASEVRALCVVELLSDLKKDSVAGDFFIYLMQELTNVISDFSEDLNFEGTVLIYSSLSVSTFSKIITIFPYKRSSLEIVWGFPSAYSLYCSLNRAHDGRI